MTGSVLNGTTPREASIQESIRESDISHVYITSISDYL